MDYQQVIMDSKLRYVGDEVADTVFIKLKQALKHSDNPASLLEFDKLGQQPAEVQSLVQGYFTRCGKLPSWHDEAAMERGAEIFCRFGPQIVVSLFCNALPACYSCARGAAVLMYTGRLVREGDCDVDHQRYTNRVMETAQFIMNVMAPNAMMTSDGIESVLKIRLIHAAIRHYLSPNFPVDTHGLPINQQDLLGTLMSFSYLSLQTLDKFGVRLSDQQQHDFLHLWNVIGFVLGIKQELLPKTLKEAELINQTILIQQSAPSHQGIALTKSLTTFIDKVLWRDSFMDFSGFMIRYLLGDERADMLDVKPYNPVVKAAAVPSMRVVMRCYQLIVRSNPMLKRWINGASIGFLQALVKYYAKEKQIEFKIPRDYRDSWHL